MEAKIPTFSELFTFGCLFVLLANPAGFGKKQYGVSQSAFVYNGKPMCIRLSGTCPPSPGSESSQKTENTQDSTSARLPGRPIKEQLQWRWRRHGLGDLEGVGWDWGSVCSPSPPELALSAAQLSLCPFCSVVATFSLLHFPPLEICTLGSKAARPLLLWEGWRWGGWVAGVFDVEAKVVWRD